MVVEVDMVARPVEAKKGNIHHLQLETLVSAGKSGWLKGDASLTWTPAGHRCECEGMYRLTRQMDSCLANTSQRRDAECIMCLESRRIPGRKRSIITLQNRYSYVAEVLQWAWRLGHTRVLQWNQTEMWHWNISNVTKNCWEPRDRKLTKLASLWMIKQTEERNLERMNAICVYVSCFRSFPSYVYWVGLYFVSVHCR